MDTGMYIFPRRIIFFSILKHFFSFHFYRPISIFSTFFRQISFSEERENTIMYQAFSDSIFLYNIALLEYLLELDTFTRSGYP